MPFRCLTAIVLAFVCSLGSPAQAPASSIHFLKSMSGPSGKIVDDRFVFDQVRSRFVYPQDQTLTVYFEWEAPPGDHSLAALWKGPDGRVASISPDLKMESKTSRLHAYWIYQIAPGMASGIWTVEIRVDGEPAGSHSFELVVPEAPKKAEPEPPPVLPSLDDIYASAGRSLVWIYKLGEASRRTDTSLGFVSGVNQVTTAFQAIDGTLGVEVEFPGGRRAVTHEVWACDRLADWAVLNVDSAQTPALRRMELDTVPVGERYLVFNVEAGGARVIGGVDITGKRTVPGFGDRIQISPSPSREAVGGPLLTPKGLVAGIVGGSTTPGARFGEHAFSISAALWSRLAGASAAIPISAVPVSIPSEPVALHALLEQGILTPPITPMLSLVYGGSARAVSKRVGDMTTADTSEFSHRDQTIWIYTLWQKKDKEAKGLVSAKVYDYRNHLLVDVSPKKISIPEAAPLRVAFDFAPGRFPAGVYRVDVLWDGRPSWRTFFTVTD